LQLRLESPLASYSRPGTAFVARVFGSEENAVPILPAGSTVRGVVRSAHSVGLGLRRERAGLTLEFEGCQLPDGDAVDCDVHLLAVDNARETVHKDNRIRGMLAASHPPSLLSGLWYRPDPSIFLRPLSGLSGLGGMLCGRLMPGPIGAAIFITSRLIFFRIPDPEITLPAGTDLIARVGVRQEIEPAGPAATAPLPDGLMEWLASVPGETTRADGALTGDRINIALVGTETELTSAFEAAGWDGTDPINARNFARSYSAFTGMKTYRRAPVSMIHYEGRGPDLVFQKSFNTLARRHHIRLWKRVRPGGETVWLGAATHDVGLLFDWNRMTLTHRIDPHIDRERSKVVNDLSALGCLKGTIPVAPIGTPRVNPGEPVITDGLLLAGQLRACAAGPAVPLALSKPHKSRVAVSVRRVVLESRYYLLRANAYRFAYEYGRWAFLGHKGPDKIRQYAMALK
jgi:hypothetical protein